MFGVLEANVQIFIIKKEIADKIFLNFLVGLL